MFDLLWIETVLITVLAIMIAVMIAISVLAIVAIAGWWGTIWLLARSDRARPQQPRSSAPTS
jgi:hypothetical protein